MDMRCGGEGSGRSLKLAEPDRPLRKGPDAANDSRRVPAGRERLLGRRMEGIDSSLGLRLAHGEGERGLSGGGKDWESGATEERGQAHQEGLSGEGKRAG